MNARNKVLITVSVIFVLVVALCLGLYLYNESINEDVTLTKHVFEHEEVPASFDGYKIFMISDLHNAPFSDMIIKHIRETEPDIIVFTGDMVQLPHSNLDETLKIAKAFEGEIRCYAVSGNHEKQNDNYEEIIYDKLWGNGIICLEDDSVCIERGDESFLLLGIADLEHDELSDEDFEHAREAIKDEFPDGPCFSVCLSHRADIYPEIKDSGCDLILSGHLHGGIVRLPFIGGIIGDNGKLDNPDYDYGYYKEGDSSAMIVSSGCDQNPEKKRYFNPPEVVLITLKSKAK